MKFIAAPPADPAWRTLKIGGGGQVVAIYGADDGTLVARSDSASAYRRAPGGSVWVDIINSNSMPSSYYTGITNKRYNSGIWEIAIAPSDSSRIYVFYNKDLFVSKNGGSSFTQTAYTTVSAQLTGVNYTLNHIAIDPINPDHVIASDTTNIYRSTDGGANWTKLNSATIPNASSTVGYHIVFDRSGGTSSGKTKNIYISSTGSQVYASTDAGETFSATSSGPTSAVTLIAGADGVLWLTTGVADSTNSGVWKLSSGTWSQFSITDLNTTNATINGSNPAVVGIAIAPGGSNPVLQMYRGDLNVYNGSSWSGFYSFTRADGDAPWLASCLINLGYLVTKCLLFDPLIPNKLWSGNGIGAFTTPVPSGTFQWTVASAGIENLTTNQIVSSPSYDDPLVGAWDKGYWIVSDPDSYQSANHPNLHYLNNCWDLTYAALDSTFICGLITRNGTIFDDSGYSTDGGTTWNLFTTKPVFGSMVTNAATNSGTTLHFASLPMAIYPGLSCRAGGVDTHVTAMPSGTDVTVADAVTVASGATVNFNAGMGGCIAAKDSNHIIIVPQVATYPIYTKDGGATWRPIDFTGFSNPATGICGVADGSANDAKANGWGVNGTGGAVNCCATWDADGNAYLANLCNPPNSTYNGLFKSTDNGDTWSQLSSGIPNQSRPVNLRLRAVPGHAGHLFFSDGLGTMKFWDGSSWNTVTDQSSHALTTAVFGFGPVKAGGSYPTIYAWATINSVLSYWRADDFDTSTFKATWTSLGSYPGNNLDNIRAIEGDANIWNKIYVSLTGSGFLYYR